MIKLFRTICETLDKNNIQYDWYEVEEVEKYLKDSDEINDKKIISTYFNLFKGL